MMRKRQRKSMKEQSRLPEDLEADCSRLDGYNGILVPGGFGVRGIAGKVAALQYARTRRIPCLGICLGMQCMVIEFARNVMGFGDADSTEFNPATTHPVIDLMPDQRGVIQKGGTMRLGAYPCRLTAESHAAQLYGKEEISERHRHRFECSNDFRAQWEAAGLKVGGTSPDGRLVEMVELPEHPFYVGCQFHPEFQSRPFEPHPLFVGLVRESLKVKV